MWQKYITWKYKSTFPFSNTRPQLAAVVKVQLVHCLDIQRDELLTTSFQMFWYTCCLFAKYKGKKEMQIESERVAFSEILWILVGVGANCYGIPFWWCNITIQTDCYCCTSHHLSFMLEHSRLKFHNSRLSYNYYYSSTITTTTATYYFYCYQCCIRHHQEFMFEQFWLTFQGWTDKKIKILGPVHQRNWIFPAPLGSCEDDELWFQ